MTTGNINPKRENPFWTEQSKNEYKEAVKRLKTSSTHPMLNELYLYDGISHETLMRFKAGIIERRGKDWVCFPYQSGIQLYRRESGQKEIRAVKGSKPNQSFFSLPESEQKEKLIIAKSPRETMLLHQLIGDKARVIGLASGEVGTLTATQEQYLREALKGIDSVYVLLDTDNPNSKSISMSLSSKIDKIHSKDVYQADISKYSNETFKDITDAVRAGKDSEYVEDLLNSAENVKNIISQSSENIRNIKNITPQTNGLEVKPGQFPESVYNDLPGRYRDLFNYVDRIKNKDILLMASLPVIAAHLDGVFAKYGHDEFSPDLYSMIIASAAAGKGYANQARQIGLRLSDYYEKENQRVLDLRDSDRGSGQKNDSQSIKSLFFPANSSSRALYDLLNANEGKGLIFETEIDTMLTAIGQDWGNFSDLTRKAFHHESCSLSRKGELLTIKNPKLSIFMSGTHDQFRDMFRNTENGLYTRFAFYTFESELEWISQRPSEDINQLHLHIDEFSGWLFDLNKKLNTRDTPLEVTLADHCWKQMDDYFISKVEEFKEEGYPEDLVGNLWRSGIILIKVSMILTILRAYIELGDGLLSKETITVKEIDFKNALTIVDTLLDHSFYLYGSLNKGSGSVFKNQQIEQFFNGLPAIFSTENAKDIGTQMDLSPASIDRYLKKLVVAGSLAKIKHGEYAKVSSN